MANVPTYPGVYIEEIASGVHTIIGVQTSIAAFVGPTKYGPIDKPSLIHSYADFERTYGGQSPNSPLSFAVQDFFVNGGSTAVIARVYRKAAAGEGKATISLGSLKLEARDPGTWGNDLRISVNVRPDKTFDLTVALAREGRVEYMSVHRNLSADGKADRQVDHVLENESDMVRVVVVGIPNPSGDRKPNTAQFDNENAGTAFIVGEGGLDGDTVLPEDLIGPGTEKNQTGLYLLDKADLFNILCIPPLKFGETLDSGVIDLAISFCKRRRAILLIDPPAGWTTKEKALEGLEKSPSEIGSPSENAAIYFPHLVKKNPYKGNMRDSFVPCGAVAGVMARTDADRGVWKAPAGLDATLLTVPELSVKLNDMENGDLNPHGLNCLRTFADVGNVVWGARTRKGSDQLASEWKYVPIRRLALFLEETLYRNTKWIVFEPNDEPLWSQIRLNIGSFMHGMFRKGAFQGSSPKDAYFVKCDGDTTQQDDRDAGIVNIIVGFAPLKPAEFVIIKFQQIAGQLAM